MALLTPTSIHTMSAKQASSNVACHCAATPSPAFIQCSPIAQLNHSQVVVPTSYSSTYDVHANPNITSTTDVTQPTIFPPGKVEIRHTSASYHAETIPELKHNDHDTWSLSLSVPVPTDLINPTLRSLVYIVKYATTHDNGNSTVQTDVALTTKSCPAGIILGSPAHKSVYRSGPGYGPRMIDQNLALCLSTAPAVKCNGGNAQWSHYIDHHHLLPDVRIVQQSNLYLNFHVAEYPTAKTLRCLVIEVSASWTEDVAARKAKEEAERKAKEEAERKAKEEAERKAKEEAARKAKEEAERKAKEEAERQAKEEAARKAKEEADRKAKEEADRKAKEEADKKAKEAAAAAAKQVQNAPPVADPNLIEQAMKNHPESACTNGYGWVKKDWGYQCGGGGHKLTWAQLGMQ
jgi:DNA segregation ATPase FtsK/SpoIIIE-like protein